MVASLDRRNICFNFMSNAKNESCPIDLRKHEAGNNLVSRWSASPRSDVFGGAALNSFPNRESTNFSTPHAESEAMWHAILDNHDHSSTCQEALRAASVPESVLVQMQQVHASETKVCHECGAVTTMYKKDTAPFSLIRTGL